MPPRLDRYPDEAPTMLRSLRSPVLPSLLQDRTGGRMPIHRFPSIEVFARIQLKDPVRWARFALSPGGAASILGITRQAIYAREKDGKLEVVRTADGFILVDAEAVIREVDKRKTGRQTRR